MTNLAINDLREDEIRVSYSKEVYAQIVARAKQIVNIPFEKVEDVIDRIINSEISIKISHLCRASKLQERGVSVDEVEALAKTYLMEDYLNTNGAKDVLGLMNRYQYGLKTNQEEEALLTEAASYAEGVLAPISPLEAFIRGNQMICTQKALGHTPTKDEFSHQKHLLDLLSNKHHADASAARARAKQTLEQFNQMCIAQHVKAANMTGWKIETQYQDTITFDLENLH